MKPYIALAVFAAATVLIAIAGNWNGDFVWDEGFWNDNLHLLEQHGFSTEFLLGMKDQAPGPLWQVIHWLAKPITQLHPGRMRLLNLALAIGVLGLLGRTIAQWKAVDHPHLTAFLTMCVPGIALMSGTAMTEIPTLLFALGYVCLTVQYVLAPDRRTSHRLALAALAGILLGVTVLSRANFLAMAFATPCLIVLRRVRADWRVVTIGSAISLVVALAISGPVFRVWGGLVPPDVAGNAQLSVNWWNLVLTAFQLTAVVLVLSPTWFRASLREYFAWGSLGIVLLVINVTVGGVEHQSSTVSTVLNRIGLGDSAGMLVARGTPALFMTYCGFFISRGIRYAFAHCRDVVPLFGFLIAAVLVAGTSIIPLNFGLRTSAQIAPFLAMALAPQVLSGRGSIPLKLLGLGLGNYYLWAQLAQWS